MSLEYNLERIQRATIATKISYITKWNVFLLLESKKVKRKVENSRIGKI